jgi:RimJ/RimL family protein N-acetyltransferase
MQTLQMSRLRIVSLPPSALTSLLDGAETLPGLPEDGVVEIGYGVIPSARGRGFATEAAASLVGWARLDPRCAAITALGVRPGNTASERVLEKLGMQLVCRSESESDWRTNTKDLRSGQFLDGARGAG